MISALVIVIVVLLAMVLDRAGVISLPGSGDASEAAATAPTGPALTPEVEPDARPALSGPALTREGEEPDEPVPDAGDPPAGELDESESLRAPEPKTPRKRP